MHLDTGAPTRRVTQPEVGATQDLWQKAGQPWRGLSLETSTHNRGLRLLEGHPLRLQGGHLLPLGHPLCPGLWRKGGPKLCNFLHGPNPEILIPQFPNYPSWIGPRYHSSMKHVWWMRWNRANISCQIWRSQPHLRWPKTNHALQLLLMLLAVYPLAVAINLQNAINLLQNAAALSFSDACMLVSGLCDCCSNWTNDEFVNISSPQRDIEGLPAFKRFIFLWPEKRLCFCQCVPGPPASVLLEWWIM